MRRGLLIFFVVTLTVMLFFSGCKKGLKAGIEPEIQPGTNLPQSDFLNNSQKTATEQLQYYQSYDFGQYLTVYPKTGEFFLVFCKAFGVTGSPLNQDELLQGVSIKEEGQSPGVGSTCLLPVSGIRGVLSKETGKGDSYTVVCTKIYDMYADDWIPAAEFKSVATYKVVGDGCTFGIRGKTSDTSFKSLTDPLFISSSDRYDLFGNWSRLDDHSETTQDGVSNESYTGLSLSLNFEQSFVMMLFTGEGKSGGEFQIPDLDKKVNSWRRTDETVYEGSYSAVGGKWTISIQGLKSKSILMAGGQIIPAKSTSADTAVSTVLNCSIRRYGPFCILLVKNVPDFLTSFAVEGSNGVWVIVLVNAA